MRKVILLLTLVLIAAPALAQKTTGNGALSGPHYQFNIIGSPKGISGDTSNGRAIMVPLKNTVTGINEIVCEAQQYILNADPPTTFDQVPSGARIYFEASDTFEIVDRDATDGSATIKVPVNGDQITFDIYLRVLGKPNTCMDIDAYAYSLDQGLYFLAGSIDVNRKAGRSTFVKVNGLFTVSFCQVDTTLTPPQCIAGTTQDLSVFNNVFQSYFWDILNNGTRIVQVRLYPR